MRQLLRFTIALVAVVVAVSPVFADSPTKLASKVLLFHEPTITIDAKKDAQVGQLQLRVNDETIRVTQVVVHFADGSSETVDIQLNLYPGLMSEPMALDRTGTVKSIDMTYTGTQGAQRARITVYGS